MAAILAYSSAIKENRSVPMTTKDDKDLNSLKNPSYEDGAIEDDEGDQGSRRGLSAKSSSSKSDLVNFVRGKTKTELEALVLDLSKSEPKIREQLVDQARLAGGKVNRIVSSLRREIANVTSSRSWKSHWSDEGEVADFGRIEKNMQGLLDQGHYEAVLQVGDELLATAIDYVETCDDDGDVASQVRDCFNIAFNALSKVNWPPERKLLWAIDAELKDQWDICAGAAEVEAKISDKTAWSKVADTLHGRLRKMVKESSEDDFSRNYRRDALSNRVMSKNSSLQQIPQLIEDLAAGQV